MSSIEISIPAALLLLLAVYSLKAIVMIIPGAVIYIGTGIFFPTGWAILITYIGLALELAIGYANGKILGEIRVNKLLANNKRAVNFLENRKDNLFSLCFISRVLPLPFDLLSMFFGAVKMPFRSCLFISLLGKSPVMIPYVIAGASVNNLFSAEFLVPFGVSLIIMLNVFIIYRRITKKRLSGL